MSKSKKSTYNRKHKAGVVACRLNDEGGVEILLVTARLNPGSWIFPVGTVDNGETRRFAAARECEEESGFQVTTGPKIIKFDLLRPNRIDRFTFYLARVTGEAHTYELDRQRRWVTPHEAMKAVPKVFRPVAETAVAMLAANSGPWLQSW